MTESLFVTELGSMGFTRWLPFSGLSPELDRTNVDRPLDRACLLPSYYAAGSTSAESLQHQEKCQDLQFQAILVFRLKLLSFEHALRA